MFIKFSFKNLFVFGLLIGFSACNLASGPRTANPDENAAEERLLVSQPDIAMDGRGNALVTYTQNQTGYDSNLVLGTVRKEVVSTRYLGASGGWEDATYSISDRPNTLDPSEEGEVAMSAQGYATSDSGSGFAIWSRGVRYRHGVVGGEILGDAASRGVYVRRYNASNGWEGTSQSLSLINPSFVAKVSITMNEAGTSMAVFTVDTRIYSKRFVPGAGWSETQETVSEAEDGNQPSQPQVGMHSSGTTHAVWKRGNGIYANVWTGGSWQQPQRLNPESASDVTLPKLGFNFASDSPIAIWTQGGKLYANRFSGGQWGGAIDIADISGSLPDEPFNDGGDYHIGMSGSGRAMAVWTGANSFLYKTYEPGTGWLTMGQIVQESQGFSDFAMDFAMNVQGNAVVVWRNPVDRQLYGSQYERASGVWGAKQAITVDAVNVESPRVAIDDTNTALAVWSEDQGPENSNQRLGKYVFGAAVPRFTISPALPQPGQAVTFDASTSVIPAGTSAVYEWDFNANADGTGTVDTTLVSNPVATFTYPAAGFYNVRLTIHTNGGNRSASTTQTFEVAAVSQTPSGSPTANFTMDFDFDGNDSFVTLNASSSTPSAPGETIDEYYYDFSWTPGNPDFSPNPQAVGTAQFTGNPPPGAAITLTVVDIVNGERRENSRTLLVPQ